MTLLGLLGWPMQLLLGCGRKAGRHASATSATKHPWLERGRHRGARRRLGPSSWPPAAPGPQIPDQTLPIHAKAVSRCPTLGERAQGSRQRECRPPARPSGRPYVPPNALSGRKAGGQHVCCYWPRRSHLARHPGDRVCRSPSPLSLQPQLCRKPRARTSPSTQVQQGGVRCGTAPHARAASVHHKRGRAAGAAPNHARAAPQPQRQRCGSGTGTLLASPGRRQAWIAAVRLPGTRSRAAR